MFTTSLYCIASSAVCGIHIAPQININTNYTMCMWVYCTISSKTWIHVLYDDRKWFDWIANSFNLVIVKQISTCSVDTYIFCIFVYVSKSQAFVYIMQGIVELKGMSTTLCSGLFVWDLLIHCAVMHKIMF